MRNWVVSMVTYKFNNTLCDKFGNVQQLEDALHLINLLTTTTPKRKKGFGSKRQKQEEYPKPWQKGRLRIYQSGISPTTMPCHVFGKGNVVPKEKWESSNEIRHQSNYWLSSLEGTRLGGIYDAYTYEI